MQIVDGGAKAKKEESSGDAPASMAVLTLLVILYLILGSAVLPVWETSLNFYSSPLTPFPLPPDTSVIVVAGPSTSASSRSRRRGWGTSCPRT